MKRLLLALLLTGCVNGQRAQPFEPEVCSFEIGAEVTPEEYQLCLTYRPDKRWQKQR